MNLFQCWDCMCAKIFIHFSIFLPHALWTVKTSLDVRERAKCVCLCICSFICFDKKSSLCNNFYICTAFTFFSSFSGLNCEKIPDSMKIFKALSISSSSFLWMCQENSLCEQIFSMWDFPYTCVDLQNIFSWYLCLFCWKLASMYLLPAAIFSFFLLLFLFCVNSATKQLYLTIFKKYSIIMSLR